MKLGSISWIVFAAAAALFLLIKMSAIGYSASDENTYYKMGELVASGKTPYVDFFFAHPPLQIYAYAAVFRFFGFNLGILKFLSAAAAVAAGLFVLLVLNERSNLAGIAGTLLFFFTHSVLLFTSFPTGTEFVMMFSAAGFYFFYKKRGLVSGVLFGLGSITGLLALIPAAVCGGWLLFRSFREFRSFLTGFGAVFVVVNGAFMILTRGEYITQVVSYNLLKPEGVLDKGDVIVRMLSRNWLILAAAAAVIFAKWRLRFSVVVPAMVVAAYAAAFAFMKTVFDYYSLAVAPFAAILAGQGIAGVVESFRLRKIMAYSAVFIVIAAVGFINYGNFVGNDAHDFPKARDVANFVRDNSAENETIFGEDATTPLISLLSGREISLDFVDSNDLRFRTGMEDADEVIDRLRNSSVRFFLERRLDYGNGVELAYGVSTIKEFNSFLKEECEVAQKFESEWQDKVKAYYVYDCG